MTLARTYTATAVAIPLAVLVPQLAQHCMSDRKAEQLASDPVFLKLTHREHEIFHICEYAERRWNERFQMHASAGHLMLSLK
jgi:hypothetical protein